MVHIAQYCEHCGQAIDNDTKTFTAISSTATTKTVCCIACQQVVETIPEDPVKAEKISTQNKKKSTSSIILAINNIHCVACKIKIEKSLNPLNGVYDIQINSVTGHADVCWNNEHITLERIISILKELGYDAAPLSQHKQSNRQALKRLMVAGLGMMQVMMYAVGLYSGAFQGMDPKMQFFLQLISMLVTTPIVIYSGKPFFTAAWRDLCSRHIGMDVPVALAIAIAYGASIWATFTQQGHVYYDSVTMFIFFLSLGRYAEMRARYRAGAINDALIDLVPPVTTRLIDDQPQTVAVSTLKPGDLLLIKPGDTIPVDCIVLEGKSRVDESLLTGESTPRVKTVNDALIGGSVNYDSVLHVQVEAVGTDTVLSNIIRLLERAQHEKPRIARLANTVAGYFVVSILLIALSVGVVWWLTEPQRAIEIVLAVLVVTCPCALSLATPTALTVATGQLAKNGLLVTRSNVIEALTKVDHFIFDKTGTLTFGQPRIKRLHNLGHLSDQACINIASALERYSEHPIAKAFQENKQVKFNINAVMYTVGQGIEAHINERNYRIGTIDFVKGLNRIDAKPIIAKLLPNSGNHSFITLGDENELLAIFELADTLRPFAKSTIQELQKLGFSSEILSGDQVNAVENLARQLGISGQAQLSPEEKLNHIRILQKNGKNIIMAGDGVNDAPVLSAANVSVAMSSGASLTQTTADMILIQDSLQALPRAIHIAQKTLTIIRQNIGWAIFYNIVALPLAATGMLAPWAAAIGMSASSLLVVLNALRIGKQEQATQADTILQEIKV